MKNRVAYLVSQFPAPSHTFIRREIDALRRRGVELRTFSVRRPADGEIQSDVDRRAADDTWYVLPASPAAFVRSHLVGAARRPVRYAQTLVEALRHRTPGVKSLVWSTFYFGEAIHLAYELDAQEIDHLHAHFGNAGAIVGMLATRYLDIPWSFTIHGTSEFDFPAGELLGKKITAARFVACVSHFGRARAMRRVDAAHWAKMFINRCGLELHRVPRAKRNTEGRARLRLVNVGRLSPEKGQLGLLEAFASVVDRGLDAELIIVGDGPEGDRVRAAVVEHGLEDRVTLTGRMSESRTLSLIADADVFVLSSFMEGLPVVLMEAFAAGVPVVAPRVAGIPELVEDGVSGLLFDAANWKQLAEYMLRIGRDPGMRARFGAAGHTRVVQEFDIERAIRPLLERFAPHLVDDKPEDLPVDSARLVVPAPVDLPS